MSISAVVSVITICTDYCSCIDTEYLCACSDISYLMTEAKGSTGFRI